MLSRAFSGALQGIDAYIVQVEADVARGIPGFATVGLPQGAVREGKERVVAAIRNTGYDIPPRRITINLAPADLRKEGTAFDLPIAIAILASTGQVAEGRLGDLVLLGELGLDGTLRPTHGALSVALAVRDAGLRGLILPRDNVSEAAMVEGVEVRGARTLREVIDHLDGRVELARTEVTPIRPMGRAGGSPDLGEVRGQAHVKRALEVAAAGAHNILMLGSPGSGKTMLARRIPGILPCLDVEEALQVTRIHSVAGILPREAAMVVERPFRSPHHSISEAGLVGGGANPRPGEVSLAHLGVLFLDELPEFRRHVLDALRQPLEEATVTIARAGTTLAYPARFMFVAAMNPCPCGYLGDPRHACSCPTPQIQRYLSRVSGPLLDRIDIHVEVGTPTEAELTGGRTAEPSSAVARRVAAAREVQRSRFPVGSGRHANAHMLPQDLRVFCRPEARAASLLRRAIGQLGFSARAYHRVLRLARTIADLDGREVIATPHVAEAIQYRSLDRLLKL